MKAHYALALIATFAAAPAAAADNLIEALSKQSGLSERQVQMVVGNRSAFVEYRTAYDRSVRQLKKAIGDENYQRLLSGQPIKLPERDTGHVAAIPTDKQDATP